MQKDYYQGAMWAPAAVDVPALLDVQVVVYPEEQLGQLQSALLCEHFSAAVGQPFGAQADQMNASQVQAA